MAFDIDFSKLNWRDPRVAMRLVIGALLLANLVACYFVFFPLGGAPEELNANVQSLQRQTLEQRRKLDQVRGLSTKVTRSRNQEEDFEGKNFTDRQVAYSTIVSEINQSAQQAGVKVKDHALVNEGVEGSDTLSMITVSANYEGTYADLLAFVNKMDRSSRFVIIEALSATPQQNSNVLNIAMKMNIFVRNTQPLPRVEGSGTPL